MASASGISVSVRCMSGSMVWGPEAVGASASVALLQGLVGEVLGCKGELVQLVHRETILDDPEATLVTAVGDLAESAEPPAVELLAVVLELFNPELQSTLMAEPFNLSNAEIQMLQAWCSKRNVKDMRVATRMDGRRGHMDYTVPLANKAGPWMIIGATKADDTSPSCIVGGFHSVKFWERRGEEGYGYDRDETAFIFAFATPQGRTSLFLPVRQEVADRAIYRGPGCLIDFGSGNSYETDLEFRLGGLGQAQVGGHVSLYGPVGTSWDCLLGPEARGWHATRQLEDFLILCGSS